MAQLFELSAELTLDPADFLRAVRQAEDAARRLQTAIDRSMSVAASAMGRLQGSAASAMDGVAASIQRAIDKARELSGVRMTPTEGTAAAPRLATGLDYVPYNEFPALLHEGEAVLTNAVVNIFLKQASTDIDALQDKFKLSNGERSYLLSPRKGHFLLKMASEGTVGFAYSTDYEKYLIERHTIADRSL